MINISKKREQKLRSFGYTLVELAVVIAIISILTTLSVLSYTRIRASSRDAQRSSRIEVVYQSLEAYYQKNGEYPSCSDMTKSSSVVTDTTLAGLDPDNLLVPDAPAGSNSFACATPTTDAYGYIGGGTNYQLQYLSEMSNQVVTVNSRH